MGVSTIANQTANLKLNSHQDSQLTRLRIHNCAHNLFLGCISFIFELHIPQLPELISI